MLFKIALYSWYAEGGLSEILGCDVNCCYTELWFEFRVAKVPLVAIISLHIWRMLPGMLPFEAKES